MVVTLANVCTPAKIYFTIAVIASILSLSKGVPVMFVTIKIIFAYIWTLMLSWTCTKGYKNVSWFLVVLPYALIILAYFTISKNATE